MLVSNGLKQIPLVDGSYMVSRDSTAFVRGIIAGELIPPDNDNPISIENLGLSEWERAAIERELKRLSAAVCTHIAWYDGESVLKKIKHDKLSVFDDDAVDFEQCGFSLVSNRSGEYSSDEMPDQFARRNFHHHDSGVWFKWGKLPRNMLVSPAFAAIAAWGSHYGVPASVAFGFIVDDCIDSLIAMRRIGKDMLHGWDKEG